MSRQTLGGDVERLLPAHRHEATVTLYHRLGDPIVRMDEAGAEPTFHAQHAEARAITRDVVGHDGQARVLAHRDRDAAADAAVGTRGLHAALDLGRRLLGTERAGRTG